MLRTQSTHSHIDNSGRSKVNVLSHTLKVTQEQFGCTFFLHGVCWQLKPPHACLGSKASLESSRFTPTLKFAFNFKLWYLPLTECKDYLKVVNILLSDAKRWSKGCLKTFEYIGSTALWYHRLLKVKLNVT